MLHAKWIGATTVLVWLVVFCTGAGTVGQSPAASPEEAPVTDAPPPASDSRRVGAPVRRADPSAMLPGITIDREAGHVDIEAEVVNRDVKWLELLLCKAGGREHETILATEARPSHVHLSLILLGLKPGQVQRGEPIDPANPEAGYRIIPAEGPAIRVELLYHEPGEAQDAGENGDAGSGAAGSGAAESRDRAEDSSASRPDDASAAENPADHENGEDPEDAEQPKGPLQRVEAGTWVYDRTAERTLAGKTWLFTGSRFAEHEGKQVYVADFTGTLISLVHFGDDVLGPRNDLTNRTDEQAMGANTQAIPPVGTAVTVRLTPVEIRDAPNAEPHSN
jgi:hypothetical protein